jgi:hypothetical protein
MDSKALLEVDARIAKLRDNIAAGHGAASDSQEIDRLVERRMALLNERATAKVNNSSYQSETIRARN